MSTSRKACKGLKDLLPSDIVENSLPKVTESLIVAQNIDISLKLDLIALISRIF